VQTISSPGFQSREADRERAKLSVVILAPNATSSTVAFRKRAAVPCARSSNSSVARDVENGPPAFAFASRRYAAIASITASGTCVPPGPSKNASGCCNAVKRARTASTVVTTRATCTPA
jgi:hypothetical protein